MFEFLILYPLRSWYRRWHPERQNYPQGQPDWTTKAPEGQLDWYCRSRAASTLQTSRSYQGRAWTKSTSSCTKSSLRVGQETQTESKLPSPMASFLTCDNQHCYHLISPRRCKDGWACVLRRVVTKWRTGYSSLASAHPMKINKQCWKTCWVVWPMEEKKRAHPHVFWFYHTPPRRSLNSIVSACGGRLPVDSRHAFALGRHSCRAHGAAFDNYTLTFAVTSIGPTSLRRGGLQLTIAAAAVQQTGTQTQHTQLR